MSRRVYLDLNTWSGPGKLATPHAYHVHLIWFPFLRTDAVPPPWAYQPESSLFFYYNGHPSQTKWVCAGESWKVAHAQKTLSPNTHLVLEIFHSLSLDWVTYFSIFKWRDMWVEKFLLLYMGAQQRDNHAQTRERGPHRRSGILLPYSRPIPGARLASVEVLLTIYTHTDPGTHTAYI